MVERLELEQGSTDQLLSKIEVYGEREGGLVEAMVPIELIDRSEVAVDEAHVAELVESMNIESQKGIVSGQLTPILLGHIPGRPRFSIIDGFHRDSALNIAGKDAVFATIRPNTTEEEIDDLRILTATSHSSVSFARIHDWVSAAWDKSPWTDRITAAQAFSLANNKKMNGRYMGLSEEEASQVRAWALDKCTRWRMSAGTIWSTMSTAQVADPELVKQARTRASGHELVTLTPQHLRKIATAFPDAYAIQRAIAEVATSQNLSIQQTTQVLDVLSSLNRTGEDARDVIPDDVIATIIATDWAKMFEGQKKTRGASKKTIAQRGGTDTAPSKHYIGTSDTADEATKPARTITIESRDLPTKYMASRISLARLGLENIVLRGRYLVPPSGYTTAQPFAIDISTSAHIQEVAARTVDLSVENNFLTRFEEVEPKLLAIFRERTNAPEADAKKAVGEIGKRIALDLNNGSLQYVDFSRQQMFDQLIGTCLFDEIHGYTEGKNSPVTPINDNVRHFELSLGAEILPTLEDKAQTAVVLSGVLAIGAHSIGQVINVDRVRTTQLLDATRQRLSAAERIKQGQRSGEQSEKTKEARLIAVAAEQPDETQLVANE